MILYELRCSSDHAFEAWFRDSAAYDQQAADGEIVCPVCGGRDIGKAPMAPRLARRARDVEPAPSGAAGKSAKVRAALMELRRQVEASCEHVGDRFAEEARKIHYGETDHRNIYGEATDVEAREHVEEGVKFGRIPWLPRTDS